MKRTRSLALAILPLLVGLSLALLWGLLLPFPGARANPGVLYAAPSAQGSGDCSSWANACTLQTALSRAVNGDEIWVKAGVHYPGTNRTDTFTLTSGVALYGGFAGNETARDQRNWQTHLTVLSGDIDRNDRADASGVVTTTAAIIGVNALHVLTATNVSSSTILDGFIVTAGYAGDYDDGGGLHNGDNSHLVVRNTTFSGNYADDDGGGMYSGHYSRPTLQQVTFSGNYADGDGGGMYSGYYSRPTLQQVTFSGNSSAYDGGGMYSGDQSNLTLTSVTFISNSSGYDGGGAYFSGEHAVLTNVAFLTNTAESDGGGLYHDEGFLTMTNGIFQGNTAESDGGGLYHGEGFLTMTNGIFQGNTAKKYGGGLYHDWGFLTMTNGIFQGNTAEYDGGGLYICDAIATLTDVTFKGNTAKGDGGGVGVLVGENVVLNRVTFVNNQADGDGGGVEVFDGIVVLNRVTFVNNQADRDGGGMCNESEGLLMIDSTFRENVAGRDGGGLYHIGMQSALVNFTFSGNRADRYGGGIYSDPLFFNPPRMVNGLLHGNYATVGGGAITFDWCSAWLTNTTLSGNRAGQIGGGIIITGSSWSNMTFTLANTILWGNDAPTGPQYHNAHSRAVLVATYSDIQGGLAGTGNLNVDPQFVAPVAATAAPTTTGNYRLRPGSPVIDQGDNAAVPPEVTTDLDGNPRIAGSRVDMGAYEWYLRAIYLPLVLRNYRP